MDGSGAVFVFGMHMMADLLDDVYYYYTCRYRGRLVGGSVSFNSMNVMCLPVAVISHKK